MVPQCLLKDFSSYYTLIARSSYVHRTYNHVQYTMSVRVFLVLCQ